MGDYIPEFWQIIAAILAGVGIGGIGALIHAWCFFRQLDRKDDHEQEWL